MSEVLITPSCLRTNLNILNEGRDDFQIGMMVVFEDKKGSCLLQLVPTPIDPNDGITDVLKIRKGILGEHAFQVTRSLPGGVRIGGLYVYSKEAVQKDKLNPFIRTLIKAISLPTLPFSKPNELYLLQIGKYLKEPFFKLSIQQDNLMANKFESRDAELKFSDNIPPFSLFESRFFVNLNVSVDKNNLTDDIIKETENYLDSIPRDSISLSIDNKFVSTSSLVNGLPKTEGNKHQVQFYCRDSNFLKNNSKSPIFSLNGDYSLFCIASSSSTLLEVQQFLWEDLHRSVLQRVDVLVENYQNVKQFIPPSRLVYSSPRFLPAPISDYKFPDEKEDDSISRLQEIFGSIGKETGTTFCTEATKESKSKETSSKKSTTSKNITTKEQSNTISVPLIVIGLIVLLLSIAIVLSISN